MYTEVAEQLFNLIDNNKDIRTDFFDALAVQNPKSALKSWFDDNVNDNELQDLFRNGQNKEGFLDWICSADGGRFFMETVPEINDQNIKYLPTRQKMSDEQDRAIYQEIEAEDSSIMNQRERIRKSMEDGNYKSNDVDNDDEIQMALDALESSEDDELNVVFDIVDGSFDNEDSDDESDIGSDEVNMVFDIIDGSEDDSSDEDFEDGFEDDSSDEDFEDGSEDDGHGYDEEEDVQHKKRIYLDHHVNKVVEEIDKEEKIDRYVHKKYYVMKKKELVSTENLNKLEDELDAKNISYYDFGKNDTIAIKIYTQNEVQLNRIFEKLDFKARCVDIAHYTDDWYS